ncbi:Ras- protein Rab-13 [Desmophyllum pertusum]|uniref:Ras- protein Rab-13 n=1 Tax=Desmophyllum pertusum TaxID=174260 RepID=A0A9X0A9Q1_9CNID|nr:Ras- protein Rab-13 [Desmophyllum pertusum]
MSSQPKDYDITYKVLLIGESAVGKSSLIKCYSKPNQSFTATLLPTYGIDFVTVITIVDGVRVRLQIWDTAGQERFRTLTSMHFRGTKGILLVYDITNIGSFDQLQYWVKTMNKHELLYEEVIIVGNKCDFEKENWEVDTHTGEEFARQLGLKFYQTSAKTKENVKEVFQELAKNMKYANDPKLDAKNDQDDFDVIDGGIRLPSFDYPQDTRKKNSTSCCYTK